MVKKQILFCLVAILLGINNRLHGQIVNQNLTTFRELAVNFSRLDISGSARIQGLGGAQVSLGGDYSSANSNPAGLGMFNRSEFTFTPGFNSNSATSSYLGNSVNDSNSKIIVPGISLVFHSPQEGKGSFLGGSFAITYNRTNDFNRSFTYEAENKVSSIIEDFISDANGQTVRQFDNNGAKYNSPTGLAYYNYLISPETVFDPRGSDMLYLTSIDGFPIQREQVLSRGSQSQVNLSYGANFNDRIFVGFGIGLASLNFQSKKTYSENFAKDQYLNNLELIEDITVKGSGINATLGIIYKPVDFFQFGGSIATPTAYSLADTYQATMKTDWNDFPFSGTNVSEPNAPISTDVILSDYSLTTPWRFSGGGTFFIKKYGFITADVEWLNYGSSSYTSSTSASFDVDNERIRLFYTSVTNYKLGGEFRLNTWRVRGGFNFMPDPHKITENDTDNSITSVSFGVGYKASKFYIDATTVLSQSNLSYRPYIVDSETPLVTAKQSNTLVMVTLGFPF
jgi:hypothetical protein